MALFKRKNKDEQPRTCPDCCQIVSADATQCDLCGADLTGVTGAAPQQATTPAMPAGVERYR